MGEIVGWLVCILGFLREAHRWGYLDMVCRTIEEERAAAVEVRRDAEKRVTEAERQAWRNAARAREAE